MAQAKVTRKSRMAIVEETSGVLKAPSSGSEYVALQDGFELNGSFAVLENAELKASIGRSKSILGIEEPSGSLSHYLYHSEIEGTAPEVDLLIKGAMGASSVAGVEYDTVAASTVSVVKINTGEGASFERGEALLVKDPNGYQIRPIDSISGDDLTLGFELPSAPGVGVDLGKAVLYKPDDENHPTLSFWDYRGNGAAVQAMAGGRVSEMSIEMTAGELINMNFSFEGVSFYFDPIEITSTSNDLDFEVDSSNYSITLPVGHYKDPYEAAAALQSAMATASGEAITVSYSKDDGKFTVAVSPATTFSIDWATTVDTLGAKFGFTADDTGALSYVSDAAIGLTSPQTPVLDGASPLAAKNNEVFLGDSNDIDCICADSVTVTVTNEIAPVNCICEESGILEKLIISREVSVSISALLKPYDADKFKRFRSGQETKFMYVFGSKSGGNWEAGKSGCIYIPKCTISEHSVVDNGGVISLNMTLSGYTSSGEGEVFLNFV